MVRIAILGLLIVLTIGLSVPVYAATIGSPLSQYNSGIPLHMIQCSNDNLLMQSLSGKPYCLNADTAIKLKDRGFTRIMPSEIIPSEIIPSEIIPSEIIPSEIIPSEIIPSEIIPSEIIPNELNNPSSTEWSSKDIIIPHFPDNFTFTVPSQSKIDENFTIHLEYTFPLNYSATMLANFGSNYSSNCTSNCAYKAPNCTSNCAYNNTSNDPSNGIDYPQVMIFLMPKQFELVSTEFDILDEKILPTDMYDQFKKLTILKIPYDDSDVLRGQLDVAFELTQPLFYDDDTLGYALGDTFRGTTSVEHLLHITSIDDVLITSPFSLTGNCHGRSNFPDRYENIPNSSKNQSNVSDYYVVHANPSGLEYYAMDFLDSVITVAKKPPSFTMYNINSTESKCGYPQSYLDRFLYGNPVS